MSETSLARTKQHTSAGKTSADALLYVLPALGRIGALLVADVVYTEEAKLAKVFAGQPLWLALTSLEAPPTNAAASQSNGYRSGLLTISVSFCDRSIAANKPHDDNG